MLNVHYYNQRDGGTRLHGIKLVYVGQDLCSVITYWLGISLPHLLSGYFVLFLFWSGSLSNCILYQNRPQSPDVWDHCQVQNNPQLVQMLLKQNMKPKIIHVDPTMCYLILSIIICPVGVLDLVKTLLRLSYRRAIHKLSNLLHDNTISDISKQDLYK